jgi:hypothetical protein
MRKAKEKIMKRIKKTKSINYVYADEFKDHIKRCTGVTLHEYRKMPGINNTFLWLAVCRYLTGKLGNEPGMIAADNVCEILNINCERRKINKEIRIIK